MLHPLAAALVVVGTAVVGHFEPLIRHGVRRVANRFGNAAHAGWSIFS
jgi:hypothetical protein